MSRFLSPTAFSKSNIGAKVLTLYFRVRKCIYYFKGLGFWLSGFKKPHAIYLNWFLPGVFF